MNKGWTPKDLVRVLSRAGLCSRREAERLVAEGRVRVDGRPARDPRVRVDERRQVVTVDGQPLARAAPLVVALHKPVGVVTTHRDERGRPTVLDLLGGLQGRVFPVGRLDRDTSGLLLLTNDTGLGDALTAPARHVPKRYRAVVTGRLDERDLQRLRDGVELEDGPTRPAEVTLLGRGRRTVQLEIVLTEGRNRQVRRMVAAVGGRVRRLRRVAIGPAELGALAAGAWRVLEPGEVQALRSASAAPRSG